MPSSPRPRRKAPDARRRTFLSLSGQIEGQLREAYDCQFQAGKATQSSIAKKLGIDRATVHRRLTGQSNMTTETIADMVWALDHVIVINIYDPTKNHNTNHFMRSESERQFVPQPSPAKNGELPPQLQDLLSKNSLTSA